jgi:hypothetical protein
MRSGIGSVIWLIVGVLIAATHHYFSHADALRPIVSAVLAIVLWPLVLLGVNLHIK